MPSQAHIKDVDRYQPTNRKSRCLYSIQNIGP